MKLSFIHFAICILAFASCNRTQLPTPATTIASLQQLQELCTVEYVITKVVKANDAATWYQIGDRKIVITAEANVKAGIAMQKITEKNIAISGSKIKIQLPIPTILSVNLPPQNMVVAFEEVDPFRSPFTSAERDALVAQAEQQIKNSGAELGIIEQAKTNTQLFLTKLLMQLGFTEVVLTYDAKPNSILNQ
jgi:hypothetical protein